jgi:cytochrome c5
MTAAGPRMNDPAPKPKCSACRWEPPDGAGLVETKVRNPKSKSGAEIDGLLCQVCHRTRIGMVLMYPEANQADQQVARMLAGLGNLLLEKIEEI